MQERSTVDNPAVPIGGAGLRISLSLKDARAPMDAPSSAPTPAGTVTSNDTMQIAGPLPVLKRPRVSEAGPSLRSLTMLHGALTASASSLQWHAHVIEASCIRLHQRVRNAATRSEASLLDFLQELELWHRRRRYAFMHSVSTCTKMLDAHEELLDLTAKQLLGTALLLAEVAPVAVHTWLASLEAAAAVHLSMPLHPIRFNFNQLVSYSMRAVVGMLGSCIVVVRCLPSAAGVQMSGSGLQHYEGRAGEAAAQAAAPIQLQLVDSHGAGIDDVALDDVCAVALDCLGNPLQHVTWAQEQLAPSVMQLSFSITTVDTPQLCIYVTVFGKPVRGCPLLVRARRSLDSVAARGMLLFKRSYSGHHGGLAVNRNARLFAVSNVLRSDVQVFSLPGNQSVAAFGGEGDSPGKFLQPNKLCFRSHELSLFIADTGNHRIQEVSLHGAPLRCLGVGQLPGEVNGLCADARHVVVGLWDARAVAPGRVAVFSDETGEFLRWIGPHGPAAHQLGSFCLGMRLHADELTIAHADSRFRGRVTRLRLDGSLVFEVESMDASMQGAWPVDVEVMDTGDIVIADAQAGANCIHVFSCDGRRQLAVHELNGPIALATAGGKLFILNHECVHVWEP